MSGEGFLRCRRVAMRAAVCLLAVLTSVVGFATPVAAAELVTDYPAVSLRPGDTATFEMRVVLEERERVALSVDDAPLDWAVRILGGGREVAAVMADPGWWPRRTRAPLFPSR